MKNCGAWMDAFMEGWKNRDVESVMATIADDCKYYETGLDEPCRDMDTVRKLWAVVPMNQKDIEYRYRVVCADESVGILNYRLTRMLLPSESRQEIDGIFQITLNDEGRCNYFKQWRSARDVVGS